jgi:hypothetical protein
VRPLQEQMEDGALPATEKRDVTRLMNELIALGTHPAERFLCECGDAECRQWVDLASADYAELRDDPGWSVLAAGHVARASSRRARREAGLAMEGARALRAQAEQQQTRARRLHDEADNLLAAAAGPRAVLSWMSDVLEAGRRALTSASEDDCVMNVLVEIDELELAIANARASFDAQVR